MKFYKGTKPSYYYGSLYRPSRTAGASRSGRTYNYATTYGENKPNPLINHTVRICKLDTVKQYSFY